MRHFKNRILGNVCSGTAGSAMGGWCKHVIMRLIRG